MRRLLCEQWVQPRVDQGEKAAKDTKGCLCCVACSGPVFLLHLHFFFPSPGCDFQSPRTALAVGHRWSPLVAVGRRSRCVGTVAAPHERLLDAAETDPRCESQPWLMMFNDGYF